MNPIKGTLKCINGKIKIPKEYQLSDNKKRMHIKTPWSSMVEIKGKFCNHIQQWFRRKGKDKPYVPEGFISIDGDVFEVEMIEDGKAKKD